MDNTKMIEVTCSGVIRTKPGKDVDSVAFADVKFKMPKCPEEYYITHAVRMFPIVMKENKKLQKIVYNGLISIYVDDAVDCDGMPLCVNKDVKEMNVNELQHLACCLKVREIPFIGTCDVRKMREKAYETYMKVIKKKKILKSGLYKKKITEKIHRKYASELSSGDITSTELNMKVQEELNDCFNMIVDPNNRENSYSFANLKPLVPIKSSNSVDTKKKV